MHVKIVGAGLAGLSLCWQLLLKNIQVTVVDPLVGRGASHLASLLHPYPGEKARRSWNAAEGMRATKELLEVAEEALGRPVCRSGGILRYATSEIQKEQLIRRTLDFDDIERVGESEFFIKSGVTVFANGYLEGLTLACQKKGAVFCSEMGTEFDCVVLACGAGIVNFPEAAGLKLKLIKGQILKCRLNLEQSLIGKGYIALSEEPGICHLGSTYEKQFTDGCPNLETAQKELLPKLRTFFPDVDGLEILECCSGVRVAQTGSHLPLLQRLNEKTWAFTGLGSRGLLYHAYFAELLTRDLLKSAE